MRKFAAIGAAAFAALSLPSNANAHEAPQVRYELREQGYSQIQFLVAEAPFQVNACRGGLRYHLHIDWYGHVTERTPIGECRWWYRR